MKQSPSVISGAVIMALLMSWLRYRCFGDCN
jgi:hypothetical protein